MRRIVGLAIVLGVLACGQMAQAQVTTYSDRTVWNSAASAAPQTEDLNGFVTDTSFQGAVVPLLNMTIQEIDGPTGNGDFYNRIDVFPFQEDGKRSVNGTTYVLGEVDFTTGTFIRIDFSEPVSGWGADFISHDPNAVIDIYDQSNSLIGTTASVAVDTTFYGFLLDAGESAGRIEIRMATIFNDLFGMDDLSFVEGLAADDPTTMTTNLIVAANAPTTLNAGQAGSLTAKLNAVLALIPNGQAAAVSSTPNG